MSHGKEVILKRFVRPIVPVTSGRAFMDGRPQTGERPLAEGFRARLSRAADPRLADGLAQIVAQLADLAEVTRATPQDLRAVIAFLTEVGEVTDGRRQEWVLLADVLGLSSLIEDGAVRRPPGATPNTLAPFWRDGAPVCADGDSIARDGRGEPMLLRFGVTDLDGRPLVGAEVDVWQANGAGRFENQEPEGQPEFNLRGRFRTGPDGLVRVRTIRPGAYAVPGDGPVGRLMDRLGIPRRRPAHLQARVTMPGFQTLTTHVFDRADPGLTADPLFAVRAPLLSDWQAGDDGRTCNFTFVLARARAGSTEH
jgi:hydroxyquinol 1,2-dioxygenase